mmetsp:Transcript_97860/g.174284  ORF Transcript_97860/g.174284 Transcript_97860/m.174284 type:complete len:96 (+) Transcript_97860:95-382(+)|eukprot:CAMPEP_0197651944 /NCGR_PEP_ID=MMETSP1338-20131121/34153_1 /TAXON_ID=43686 ORGANISM="Pelagodinium beii, Strain RCC1491" /NCGR_SAMPLE_ID=MMETSP1338 /ASSEMBLY_ACC=CAM_ASM_000754 /LENGTH=95 /DNA_ID=CAMNT_0043226715 /DNA_START=95 /DNA_END=382 /DNA_ORIENTATION=+
MADDGGDGGKEEGEKEEEGGCKKCCFACLDCLAVVFTTIIACCSSTWRMTKEFAIYPIKQTFVDSADALSQKLFPYKQGVKVPYNYTEVPSFKFP